MAVESKRKWEEMHSTAVNASETMVYLENGSIDHLTN